MGLFFEVPKRNETEMEEKIDPMATVQLKENSYVDRSWVWSTCYSRYNCISDHPRLP